MTSPSELAHDLLAEAVNRAFAGERHESHLAGLAGLEPHGGSGGDVEAHAARLLAVERERRISLEEMIMRADLDRPVAGVDHFERHGLAAGVESDLTRFDEQFTGNHLVLPCPALGFLHLSPEGRGR